MHHTAYARGERVSKRSEHQGDSKTNREPRHKTAEFTDYSQAQEQECGPQHHGSADEKLYCKLKPASQPASRDSLELSASKMSKIAILNHRPQ